MTDSNSAGREQGESSSAVTRVSDHLWRIVVPYETLPPYDHTNAYLIAHAGVGALVDPAAANEETLALYDRALSDAGVNLLKFIILTHTHPDHVDGVEGVRAWRERQGESAPAVYVHANEAARLPEEWAVTVLQGERTLMVGNVAVRCLLTPGHSPGHLSLLLEADGEARPEAALVGDMAAETGSIWVGYPDGNVADYLASLETLKAEMPRLLAPGHGPLVVKVQRRLEELAEHRLQREEQVLDALGALQGGSATAAELTRTIYAGYPQEVLHLAELSVIAHLLKLMSERRAVHLGDDESGPYALSLL